MNKQATPQRLKALAASALWTVIFCACLYATWPAKLLPPEPIPKLPTIEQCGFDRWETCFAEAATQRQWIATRHEEFADAYPVRVRDQLLLGAAIWLVPLGLFCLIRNQPQRPIRKHH